ncbi:spermidine/putrescine-binding periplasmic protein [Treponema primitia ZAS-2]|uniref:Spermidine/putrescine-binding periplasmic protein n=1 Tax=Treponema primitia (strain ATCC BAA-887 / DSM 12427 / ZAS-2) TaxID=545694 RepID=F5YKS2_TREPZ|nr:extracellular solute-binding protein [Treponema primitia]AEF86598.1 spermidine/putrescine-binding periplasmic protein [Treponema primitia ZAS-2]
MKKIPVLAAALGVALLSLFMLSGCAKKTQLYVYNWIYYTPDSVLRKFEKEYDCKIVYDTFASNEELYAKLLSGGTGYDLVFPSGDYVSIMIKQGMLDRIDKTKLSNLGNIDPIVLQKAAYDPNMEYSVPYYFGAAGIAVNTARIPAFEKSWSIFGRKDLQGKMTMLDDMREVLGDALVHLGYSVNSVNPAEIAAARDLVNNYWKPNLIKFDAEAFGKGFADEDFWVVQGYAEVVYEEISEAQRAHTAFFIPPEGGPAYIDSMCLLKGAKNADLAYKFIDFIHRPDIYAEFTDYFGFPATANVPARQLKKITPLYQAEELVNTELKDDVGADLKLYDDAWLSIRVGE